MTDTTQNPINRSDPVDRRVCRRFQVRGEARFQWDFGAGKCMRGTGITRDVSRNGVFVETATPPPLSKVVRVEVTFPGGLDHGPDVWLHGEGHVVRVEPELGMPRGFGAQVGFRTGTAAEVD